MPRTSPLGMTVYIDFEGIIEVMVMYFTHLHIFLLYVFILKIKTVLLCVICVMMVPFRHPPTPLCPTPIRGLLLSFYASTLSLYYRINRIKFMTSLHRLLARSTTLLKSLTSSFNIITSFYEAVDHSISSVKGKCTLRALD